MICMQVAIANQYDCFASECKCYIIAGQVNNLHAIVASLPVSAYFQLRFFQSDIYWVTQHSDILVDNQTHAAAELML